MLEIGGGGNPIEEDDEALLRSLLKIRVEDITRDLNELLRLNSFSDSPRFLVGTSIAAGFPLESS